MKRVLITVFALNMFCLLQAQKKGVQFEQGLSWQQVKDKARAKHKFIFVDCYASWCGPCKLMDRDVYPNDSVGAVMNPGFVSVKVQLDTSKNDNEQVKAWYADAHWFMQEYKIAAFPSYLFFSPEGEIVHKAIGYQKTEAFIALARDAMDPSKQYYALLKDYQAGKKNYSSMPELAATARQFNEKKLASTIAEDYLHNYLDRLPEGSCCKADYLLFLGTYTSILSSTDKMFDCYHRLPHLVDSLVKREGYANSVVNYVVYKEELKPLLTLATEPDWENTGQKIRIKFGKPYAEKTILQGKIEWYQSHKDWPNYTRCLVAKAQKDGIDHLQKENGSIMVWNNTAWEIFAHSENRNELQKALSWSNLALKAAPHPFSGYMDTKANLLYKLGRKEEAIELEKKCLEMDPKEKTYQEALQKMQEGKPTW